MKLAIIDLDGVVADSSARFAKAEEAKTAYLADKITGLEQEVFFGIEKKANDLYWRTAFTSEYVALDTLINGVIDALNQLGEQGYRKLFLTSRPETMREATRSWLKENGIVTATRTNVWNESFPFPGLIMKPVFQQFVKTVTWKAGVVELLVRLFSVDDLLFVDDEPAIYESVAALDLPCKGNVTASLADALTLIG